MEATYTRHHKEDAQGHLIFVNKEGAVTIGLIGAASMSQAELDFYGEIFAKAVNKLTDSQKATAAFLAKRTRL